MRILFTFMCVLALGLMGCSETGGDGGSGGTAGMGGDGGAGGMPECQGPEDCDDGQQCTTDNCASGICENTAAEDGTACDESNECTVGQCASGACELAPVTNGTACGDDAGTCQQGSCRVACTERGIRDAIAAGGGPYTFGCEGQTTVTTKAEIGIDNDVILDGEGNLTVDGNESHRVFFVIEGVTAELRGFTVTRGFITGGGSVLRGAGILALGTLTLLNTTVTENTIATESGWSAEGGAIWSDGPLTLTNCTVSGNAVTAHGGEGGGIYNFTGPSTLTNCTVSGNSVTSFGSGDGEGGAIWSRGPLTLTNCTVSGNSVTGPTARGGGIYNFARPLTLTNSTVSGNSVTSYDGFGYDEGGAIWSYGQSTLTNSTVSNNSGDGIRSGRTTLINSTVSGNLGLGIRNNGPSLALTNTTVSGNSEGSLEATFNTLDGPQISTVTLTNSTVSGNIASSYSTDIVVANTVVVGECAQFFGSKVVSDGYNIESPGNTCGFDQTGDLVNITEGELNLGPLADNDGPTETHALLTGPTVSVAIDQIPGADCVDADGAPLTTDQRGFPRGSMCDVGAFEVQP